MYDERIVEAVQLVSKPFWMLYFCLAFLLYPLQVNPFLYLFLFEALVMHLLI